MQISTCEMSDPSILYAEDDRGTREVVQLMINRKFPAVTLFLAENGRKGLELFRIHQPEIVIADIKMPSMDGIRMAKEIKKLNRNARIIVTTADSDTNRILEAIDIGVNNYVLKPINQNKLFSAIEQCISCIKIEKQLSHQEAFIRKLSHAVEQSPVAVVISDAHGTIEYVNPSYVRLTGYSALEATGNDLRVMNPQHVSPAELHGFAEALREGREWKGEFKNRRKSREEYWVSASVSPIVDRNGVITHFISFQEDITERKEAEKTIRQMAYFDALTGLPNRHLFNELLHQAMAQAHRRNRILAILFLDLDRFKVINDTLGHIAGDQLLQAAARRLKKCCRRERDTVARRGGDEFIILLPELDEVHEAVRVAQNIIDAFSRAFNLANHEVFITTCIGISIFPHDGKDGDTLIKNADMAMYRAKEYGRNRYHLYTPSMDAQAFERLTLENSLRRALQREEFALHYQPKVDTSSGRIFAIEALIRWQHPEFGLIPPTQFLPLVEETGMITPLGKWILSTACNQNKTWQQAGYPTMRVAVNFSPRQFQQPNLVEMVEKVLSDTGLDPCWLELEVTENVMLQNEETTIQNLRRLSHMGIHITIDDFGTGYSSLNYIKKLPINTLKIDRSFVSDIISNADDAAIATAVITMARSLSLNVVAEGVETEEQVAFLRSLDCLQMQGYLFSRPLPADHVIALFGRQNRSAAAPLRV